MKRAGGADSAGSGIGSSAGNNSSNSNNSKNNNSKSSADSESDRSNLLAEVLKSRQTIDALNHKLAQVKTKSKQATMASFSVMEDKMIELENDLEDERLRHDRQLVGILQAFGLYDRALHEQLTSDSDGNISEDIVELFNQRQDDERLKVMALKNVLMRFAHKLHVDELAELEDAGVILVAEGGGARQSKTKNINFGSALCLSPSL